MRSCARLPPPTSWEDTLDALARAIRVAVRSHVKHPGYAGLAVLTLALGIGATTSIFSVVNAIVLQPLPHPEPEELVMVRTEMTDGRQTTGLMSPYAVTRLRGSTESFVDFSGSWAYEVAVRDRQDRPIKTQSYMVLEGFFDVFGGALALGRGFLPEEHADPPNAVVLSHRIWRTEFGADPSLVGGSIAQGNGSLTVVGIAAPEFDYPEGADLWMAFRPDPNLTGFAFDVVARLRPGVSLSQAQSELDAFSARFQEESSSFTNRAMRAEGLQDTIVGDMKATLFVLFGGAAMLLFIACANVMSLTLARGATKEPEVALRAALGAGQGRLVGQLLLESMIVAVVGAALGLLAASGGLSVLKALSPADVPRLAEVGIDRTVLLFVGAATAFAGLSVGLFPALRVVGADIMRLIGGSSRGSARGRAAGRAFDRLVVAQTGLAVALVIGAFLLVRSYARVLATDAGFDPTSVVAMDVNLPPDLYPDYREIAALHEQLIDEIEALPGVSRAGSAITVPLSVRESFFISTYVEGFEASGEPARARYRPASPGLFETLGIELVEGRLLEPSDRLESAGVAVVNRTFVESVLGDAPALGQVVRFSPFFVDLNSMPAQLGGYQQKESFEIVGVVEDVRYGSLDTPADPEVYLPYDQVTFRRMDVVAKASGAEADAIEGMRAVMQQVDPTLPVEFTTLDAVVASSLDRRRLSMFLLLAFGVSAAALAAVGMYGVISMSVTRRRPEMAVRSALGAETGNVVWLSMARGLALAGSGVALGVVIALLGRRWIAGELYEITATDPLVLVGVPLALAIVALVAVGVPALRATRIDLANTLRTER